MKELRFTVTGMHCSACSARVKKKAMSVPGVTDCEVSLMAQTLTVRTNTSVDPEQINAAVRKAGFGCTKQEKEVPNSSPNTTKISTGNRTACAVLLWGILLALKHIPLPIALLIVLQFTITILLFALHWRTFYNGVRNLFNTPDMDTLISIGTLAALFRSICSLILTPKAPLGLESAGMILAIVSFGKFLEASAKSNTEKAIQALRKLTPDTVLKKSTDGTTVSCPLEQIQVNDRILIRPGEQIPLDAIVMDGNSDIDESTLTGESIPKTVCPGTTVYAGTLNLNGTLLCKVQKTGGETLLAGMIKTVSQASRFKSKWVRLADCLAAHFVPLILLLAFLTYLLWCISGAGFQNALTHAVAVLLISCPCALGLATPVAVTIGTLRAARKGILFKNPEVVEKLPLVKQIFLDKTGTITQGKPELRRMLPEDNDEYLAIAAAMEIQSTHPLAKAILQAAKERNLPLPEAQDVSSHPGLGLKAIVNGKVALIGNRTWIEQQGMQLPASLLEREPGVTAIFLQYDNHQYAFHLRDAISPKSAEAIRQLEKMKITPVMLTGDEETVARNIASQVGISHVHARLLPDEKAAFIREEQRKGNLTAMLGDGINDASALASADIGMAVGEGADITLDCADIILLQNHIEMAPEAIRLARTIRTRVKQNLFWAFFYNVCALPIAAGILLPFGGPAMSPELGAACMCLSSLFVVTNALRK